MTDIKNLIPQRSPIMMVDELLEAHDDIARTSLNIRDDNFFLESDGAIAEPGVIEHIAQSASAFAGYNAMQAGATEPPVGYIGEVKRFRLNRRPVKGETLVTTITMGPTVNGVTIITGETVSGEETIATTQMKIYVAGE
ncbi:MAG: beta-hydroxyacyl-ACP dehydratase [Bacteroidaceae bacterium]|nr:beta-hydroxyacyl-ACP dehydratase [Bacteroidaceae bacterium]MBR6171060.1 beta-hydroxyacyl-ACP dehydratase [Bacteroidaceae bacterium]